MTDADGAGFLRPSQGRALIIDGKIAAAGMVDEIKRDARH